MNRVMIVDDDPDILQLVKTGLAKGGLEVDAAENAEVALKNIGKNKPDLIITDAMMPGKDGYELSREIRADSKICSIPIIMLTALHEENDALKAFQDGVDDFVTKPFSMQLLRARVAALLQRVQAVSADAESSAQPASPEQKIVLERASTGIKVLDKALGGGMPNGSNVLLIGEMGAGKSTLGRRFVAQGLTAGDRCMIITLDDAPQMIRANLSSVLSKAIDSYEDEDLFRIIDCYSWSRGLVKGTERFSVSGTMDLNQLAGLISDAGVELGQTVTEKQGGRRLLDSMSSLFISFELPLVQRFLAQLARTASSYGDVSTIFTLEAGSVSDHELNNIKYLMDVVIEAKYETGFMARVINMKWSEFSRQWIAL